MVVETELLPFLQWFPVAFTHWVLVLGTVVAVAVIGGYIVTAFRHGPKVGFGMTIGVVSSGVADLFRISPRRLFALTWLAMKESIRCRVVIVFGTFVVLLLFAGWFLDPASANPARLYISFVLTATTYLVLLLALFLSAFSIPNDIKNRVIYTIVTKPVRTSEIVLGRMFGFVAIGTLLLVIMGVVSYLFVTRGLAHTHLVAASDLRPVDSKPFKGGQKSLTGTSSRTNMHSHVVSVKPSGEGLLRRTKDHEHDLTSETLANKTTYKVGSPVGDLVARVPIYGKISFTNRAGRPVSEGVNIGDEWTYRSFIEGGTLASAIWTFEGIQPEMFPNGLTIEMNMGVFRTHKGDIESGVPGSIQIRNPKTGKRVEARIFAAKEFVTDIQFIPRKLKSGNPSEPELDLFDDLVADGKVEISLRCLAPAQYFGVSQSDLYLRARNASFVLNFAKGYLAIWLQMVLFVSFGVMFSTFLSGPVAMVATVGAMIAGLFHGFMVELARGVTYGGGPAESLYRLLTQDNMITEMQPGLRTTVIKMMDQVLESGLLVMSNLLPDVSWFANDDYVAYGFNIPGDWVLSRTFTAIGFFIAIFVAAHFFFKTREVAK